MATTLGRYEIRKELGRGGMATVYLGYDPQFKREVAVKVLPPQFTHDPTFFNRFEQEAETIARLEHTAIVPVYDYGRDGDHPYFVMRLMAGGDLRQAIARGPLPPLRALTITKRIGAALAKAHGRNLIHRDIKPSNILFDDDGYAYLADFGIVRLAEMTHTVTLIGTPEYMTPEQIRGEAIDGRSDIYQLGVVVYEMLTGQQPFTSESTAALLYKHAHEPAPPLRDLNADLPAACEAVIQRALAKAPADRYATAVDLAVDLAAALQTPDAPAPEAGAPPPRPRSQPDAEPPVKAAAAPEASTPQPAPVAPQRETPSPRPAGHPIPQAPPPAKPDTAVTRPAISAKDWRGLGLWVLGNALGWTFGQFVTQSVVVYLAFNGFSPTLAGLILAAITGLSWGTGQWLALRAYWPVDHRWIWATAGAYWLTAFIGGFLGSHPGTITAVSLLWDLVTGLIIGGVQWLLLRRRLDMAWVWLPTAAMGLLVNRWLTTIWYRTFGYDAWGQWLTAGSAALALALLNGALWGVITGAALVWLVRRARQAAA